MAGIADSKAGRLVRHALGAALSPIHAGEEKIATHKLGSTLPGKLQVVSDAFVDGSPIPIRYTPGGQNVSPKLSWSGVPSNTKELVLIVEDPDAPFPNPFIHWILHGLPPTTTALPEAVPAITSLPDFGTAVQGQNDMKKPGYYGPEPPLGHGIHHYHFQLFALDEALNLPAASTVPELVKAMQSHVLAEGELVGTYERN